MIGKEEVEKMEKEKMEKDTVSENSKQVVDKVVDRGS